jgi:hypothetical protein
MVPSSSLGCRVPDEHPDRTSIPAEVRDTLMASPAPRHNPARGAKFLVFGVVIGVIAVLRYAGIDPGSLIGLGIIGLAVIGLALLLRWALAKW